ncbi:MAG: Dabb family protein [Clostridia bacterium]|nr:Dabb family protein [Clostridia bacterium]
MVKHMIIWKLKECAPSACKTQIKRELEGLVGKIDGLIEMHIHTDALECSSGDLAMESLFESVDALEFYQKHPLHIEIANGLVRPNAEIRLSFDFEV